MRNDSLMLQAGRRLALLVAAAAAVAGCADVSVGLGAGASAGGVSAPSGRALVGRWSRIEPVAFGATAGYAYEVTWTFGADGSALRTTRTLAPSGAVVAAYDEPAAWGAGGGTIVVTLLGPPRVTRSLRYVIEAGVSRTVLYLDGAPFTRVG